jgi:hypothetical protein
MGQKAWDEEKEREKKAGMCKWETAMNKDRLPRSPLFVTSGC